MIEGISLQGLHDKLQEGNLPQKEIDLAKKGQKESYPNGIPVCGTDAVRFGLCSYTSHGKKINLEITKIESYRNFCNKMYNTVKFSLLSLGESFTPSEHEPTECKTAAERWILSRLNNAIQQTREAVENYQLGEACQILYSWWLYDLCDNFIEISKPYVYGDAYPKETQESVKQTIYTCLDSGLRLFHPFMPFLAEELFQRLPRRKSESNLESIMVALYPEAKSSRQDDKLEKDFSVLFDVTKKLRSMVMKFNLQGKKPLSQVNILSDKPLYETIKENKSVIETLAKTSLEVHFNEPNPKGYAIELSPDYQVLLQVKGLIDVDLELGKLKRKLEETDNGIEKTEKLINPNLKPDARKRFEDKIENLKKEAEVLKMSIKTFESFE